MAGKHKSVTLALVAGALAGPIAIAGVPEVEGLWGPLQTWGVEAIHMVVLKTGKVLMFGAVEHQVWDPATGAETLVSPPDFIFCSGHAALPDGRVAFFGGGPTYGSSHDKTIIFDPDTLLFSLADDMPDGKRWYPSCLTLADGRILVVDGDASAGPVHTADVPHAFDASQPPGQQYTVLPGGVQHMPYYTYCFPLTTGKVFSVGVGNGNEQSAVQSQTFDTVLGAWATVTNHPIPGGAAVLYDRDTILKVGGYIGTLNASNEALTIDPTRKGASWQQVASMNFPRQDLNLVLMPNGNVMAIGGWGLGGPGDVIYPCEIYDPGNNTWTIVDSVDTARTYHSSAALLPDGRIACGGSAQYNGQVFSPPYLFGPGGSVPTRPVTSSVSTAINYGLPFEIQTPNASTISDVTLVRLGMMTHSYDMNTRFVRLSFTKPPLCTAACSNCQPDILCVSAPVSSLEAPPGYYMLFILEDGVPSEAAMVQIGSFPL